MNPRLILVVMIIALLMLPLMAEAGSFGDLQTLINNTAAGGTLVLSEDYTAADGEKNLSIGKNMTLDLNGHTLDRGLGSVSAHQADGCVLLVNNKAQVTICNQKADAANSYTSVPGDKWGGVLTGGQFYGNGGAIRIVGASKVTLDGIVLSGNKAQYGGAVLLDGSSELIVTGNTVMAQNSSDYYGGAIYVQSGKLTVIGGKFLNNVSARAGAIAILSGTTGSLTDATFEGNNSTYAGNAVWSGGTLTVKDCDFIKNLRKGSYYCSGGGIYCADNSTCTVTGGNFKGNSLHYGSGIYTCAGVTLTVTGANFEGNATESNGRGGGIYSNAGKVTIKDCTFKNNTAAISSGGLYFTGNVTADITNTTITGNEAKNSGAGIAINGANAVIRLHDVTITGNKVANVINKVHNGGGINLTAGKLEFDGVVKITDNTVAGVDNNMWLCSGYTIKDAGLKTGSLISVFGVDVESTEKPYTPVTSNKTTMDYYLLDGTKSKTPRDFKLVMDSNGILGIARKNKVTFKPENGGSIAAQDVWYEGFATEPTAPTKTGYVFDGWYSDSALTQKWNFSTSKVMDDVVLTAKWVDHVHGDYTFTAVDNKIIPVCHAAGTCDLTDNKVTAKTLTLTASNASYNASAYTGASADYTSADYTTATGFGYVTEYEGTGSTGYTRSEMAPTDVGTYQALVTVTYGTGTTDKATAVAPFTIDRAKLEVTALPTATNVVNGQTLATSTLSGGKVVRLGTSQEVEGTFSWKDGTIQPTPSDSGTTEYTLVFTPKDTTNQEPVECAIKIALIYSVTVSDDENGTASATPTQALQGASVTLSATPLAGYAFDTWEVVSGSVTLKDDAFEMPGGDVEIKAHFKPQAYTVTYKDQGDKTFSGTHETGYPTVHTYTAATPLKGATKTGYTFEGWFADANCTGSALTSIGAKDYTADVVLYACWKAKETTITFDKQGGSDGSDTVTATYDSAMPTATMPTRTDYTFVGYYDAAVDGTQYYAADGSSVKTWDKEDANATLFARWTALPTYTVSFDTTGGTSVAGQTVIEGKTATKPADPTKEDYTFMGWYTDSAFTTEYDFDTPVKADLTLFAGWTALPTYTVSFDTAGGTAIAGQTVIEGKTATKPADPTKDGYTFLGWYSDSTLKTQYAFDTPVTTDLTLYAGWEKEEIPVSKITVDKTSLTLKPGEEGNVKATVEPDNATEEVVWISSDESIATVDADGKITAKKTGTITVTVKGKDGEVKAEVTVTVEADPIVYIIIEGAEQSIFEDAPSAKFASNAEYSKFLQVEVDGTKLASTDFDSYSGSTVVVLKADLIKRLGLGVHTLKIVSNDGYAQTRFTIRKLPDTGDQTPVALLLGLLAVSVLGVVTVVCGKRKKAE